MKKVNIMEYLKNDRELHISNKIMESHTRIYRLINEININRYKPAWEDIKEYDSQEERTAYMNMYCHGHTGLHPISNKDHENWLLQEIKEEKENLKTLYMIKNRRDSGMLDAQIDIELKAYSG